MLDKSPETVRQWATRGVLVRGRRVVLCSAKVGGRSHTTPEWLESFQRECNPGMESTVSTRRTSDALVARQRLFLVGVYGSQKRGKLPNARMQAEGRSAGSVPQVLPTSLVSQATLTGNRAGTNGSRRARSAILNSQLTSASDARKGAGSEA